MARFKIVVDDEEKAHAALLHSYRLVDRRTRDQVRALPRRKVGDMHTVANTDCPDGLPNCRNCGDPDHFAACRAAGHCPHCGVKHGIAPDAILAQNGYRLEAE